MNDRRRVKNKKITILYPKEVKNELGEINLEYVPLPNGQNIWAYYRHCSGKEFFAAATTNTKVEVLFEVAWRKDIDTYCKIKYNDKDYDITRIDDYEGRKKNLSIYAYAIN